MNKELIDKAWACLPREFRDEVKEEWQDAVSGSYAEEVLENLFGINNLTSDAEGEDDEVLTVPRKDIVELYQEVQKTISQCKGTALAIQSAGIKNVLWSFFGSKCLPDELNEDNFTKSEPKYRINDKVVYCGERRVIAFVTPKTKDCERTYRLTGVFGNIMEHELTPYEEPKPAEPEEHIAESRNLSQNCDKQFDNIQNNGFRKHNRLHVATRIAAALVTRGKGYDAQEIAITALEIADILIAECEKGGSK